MIKKLETPLVAKKSYKDGHVAIGIRLKCRAWHGNDSVRMDGGTDITTTQARELAAALIECADKADAKVAAKNASDVRRRQYRDREIAAGRMIVMKGSPF